MASDSDLVCLADKIQEIVCQSLQTTKFINKGNSGKSANSAKKLLKLIENGAAHKIKTFGGLTAWNLIQTNVALKYSTAYKKLEQLHSN